MHYKKRRRYHCKRCGRSIKARYYFKSGLCYACYKLSRKKYRESDMVSYICEIIKGLTKIVIVVGIILLVFFLITSEEDTSLSENYSTTDQTILTESINYSTNPKEITLSYALKGKKRTINYTVYKGLNDYLSKQPRYYYCDPICPSDIELELRIINNEEQREFLLPLVERIKEETPNEDDQVRIAVSIVQRIPYDTLSYATESADLRFPYEVLYDNKGLCGEKSKLLVFILSELGYGVVLFDFEYEAHQLVGIKCPTQYSLLDSGYCFIETTRPTIITYVPTTYYGVGELTSMPKMVPISSGKSFDGVSEEYDDMTKFKAVESLGQVLSEGDYKIWKKLEWKYDLDYE